MNVLEKILEEIKKEKNSYEADHAWNYSKGLERAEEIIRSHMDGVPDNDWIPVSERLPELNKIVEVTIHCSEWISDYDSAWIPEEEKVHHEEEYIVNVGYMGEDGYWIAFDDEGCEICCDEEFGTDKGCVYSVVTAWHLKSEPYRGE